MMFWENEIAQCSARVGEPESWVVPSSRVGGCGVGRGVLPHLAQHRVAGDEVAGAQIE